MGILPPLYPYLVHAMTRFPDQETVGSLAALGVNHAVVHRRFLAPADRDRLARALAEPSSGLAVRYEQADTVVVALPELQPSPPHALRGARLPRTRWRATASADPGRAGAAIDDDPATRWSSWGQLEQSLRRWYDPVPFPDRWQQFISDAPSHLDIDLGAPAR